MIELSRQEYEAAKAQRIIVPKLEIGRVCLFICASRDTAQRLGFEVQIHDKEDRQGVYQLKLSEAEGVAVHLYEFDSESLWRGKEYLALSGVRMTQGYLKDRRKKERQPSELGVIAEIPDTPEELVRAVGVRIAA